MDVSDGLLIDAERLAAASGVALEIDLDAVPLSRPSAGLDDLLARVTAGDDYELLFSLPPGAGSLPASAGMVTPIVRARAVAEHKSALLFNISFLPREVAEFPPIVGQAA